MSGSAASAKLIVWLTVVMVGGLGSGCASEPGISRTGLLRRLEASPPAEDFAFRFRAGGTNVNDCFLPNREFVGQVDSDRGWLVIRRTDGAAPVVISTPESTFLHQDLFEEGSVGSEWVRLTQRGAAVDEPLNAVLGPDLAGYAAPAELPPSGRATALAAVRAAEGIDALGTSVTGGIRVDRFRVRLDPARYADGAGVGLPAEAVSDPPDIVLWIASDDDVVRVEVRPNADETSAEHQEDPGWVTDYDHSPQEDVTITAPPDATPLTAGELSALSPRRLASCSLPI